jgi:hypothetical protein
MCDIVNLPRKREWYEKSCLNQQCWIATNEIFLKEKKKQVTIWEKENKHIIAIISSKSPDSGNLIQVMH